MGIFSKTDEELKRVENNKKLKSIEEVIVNAYTYEEIGAEVKMILCSYIDDIIDGKPNDFDDIETLYKVIKKLIKNNFLNTIEITDHLNKVITFYNRLIRSDEKEELKDFFIDLFVGTNGIIYKSLFDEGFYALFKDKIDYFDIMRTITENEINVNNFKRIMTYSKKVGKYCLNQDVLKRDIIAYIEGLSSVIDNDFDKYDSEQLENSRRRIGVYNISPKELTKVDYELRRIEGYVEQFEIYKIMLNEQKEALIGIIDSGREDIKSETILAINNLKELIEKEKVLLKEKLDSYLLDLEEILKNNSDAVFREIIENYKNQVEEFRRLFIGYSTTVSRDFLEIQKATEESVKKLQNYVTSEPQLQELLVKVNEQNTVREKIVELVSKEEELMKINPSLSKDIAVIPGYDKRIMVPYKHMVLPEEIPKCIIYAFNESIPFDDRLKEIEKRIRLREQNGEIFHKKIYQIIIDLMEGDWPYLWGPSGTGKSYMAKQIASIIGIPLTKAGKITEPYSVLGYNDPQGRYQITPSFIAALYGNLLFLDELDNGNPDTQVVLNDIYSELLNKLDNPNDICEITFGTDVNVDVHPNFRLLAAGNTSGEGENEAFSSRGKMDESLQERMTPIYIDYDNRVEKRILNDYPEWYKFFINFRNACLEYTSSIGQESAQGITTTRDAAAIKKYIEHNSKSVEQVIEERFIQIKDSEYRKALGRKIAEIYGIDYAKCKDADYNGSLKEADGMILARKFINKCKNGVK